ncbi:MAG: hypothetical protein IPO36_16775 [Anaerolineales bacterium]|jgi:hypothetical protein|uniref:hypothetical protein n=1 Tax=Candidatus Villigracilis affinis TaxID=3140682 RepID=UPI001B5E990F|nr:hypothetical protein [Anaerolineales bacterium]MBK9603472.1 hypothetical protein [Anaerolineales bacterium]MBL0346625.1 hypothetical protein [Anaerolineales bacterium]MBP8047297.1 hypothetical protein [Anaerolineales bacterium]
MNKKPSFLWSLAIGLAFPILQVLVFSLRFGNSGITAPITDYIFFFIGGAFIGLALIAALRRCETKGAYRATLIGFGIGVPFSIFGMVLGGMLGPLVGVMFSVSPGVFFTFVGFLIGRAFFKT